MIEVVFGSSIAGSMQAAVSALPPVGGAVGVAYLTSEKGRKPPFWVRQRMQKKVVQQEQEAWEKAVPLEGNRQDILNFPIALSVGDIQETGIGPRREAALRTLTEPEWASCCDKELRQARENLQTLLARVKEGEPVRVWTSHAPDEACGLYWLAQQLRPIGFDRLNVTAVLLPGSLEREDGVVVIPTGWGDVPASELGRMAQQGKPLSAAVLRMLANSWKQLQEENAPLRAVINGKLSSAGEDLYDFYIRREIDRRQGKFPEPNLIGDVLGRYALGIGDAWVALRIEEMIDRGQLISVTQPEPGSFYRGRVLKKWE